MSSSFTQQELHSGAGLSYKYLNLIRYSVYQLDLLLPLTQLLYCLPFCSKNSHKDVLR